jgi:hypothetical protein
MFSWLHIENSGNNELQIRCQFFFSGQGPFVHFVNPERSATQALE